MIPTAEEFLKEKCYITKDDVEDVHDSLLNVKDAMIEFAKLHCEAKEKAILEKTKIQTKGYFQATQEECLNGIEIWDDNGSDRPSFIAVIDKDSILNAYSLSNIK